jgi:hypothetical protein
MPEPEARKRTRPVVPYAGHIDGERGPGGERPGEEGQSSRPFVLLLVFVVLAAMGWFLIQTLTKTSKEQDCIMAGRRNCAPIDTSKVGN